LTVIPAQAGIRVIGESQAWILACAVMTENHAAKNPANCSNQARNLFG
jgi:hypothetical protein